MDDNILKNALGQVGSLGKQIGKELTQEGKNAAKQAASQVGFEIKEGEKKEQPAQVQKLPQEQQLPDMSTQGQQENADFVKELYARTEKPPFPSASENPSQALAQKKAMENPQKSPQEIQEMVALRQKLQSEYYQRLTTPTKRPQEAQVEQERASDRMERLEMEDAQKKKKQEEKKKPIAVSQAERKTEAPMGSG